MNGWLNWREIEKNNDWGVRSRSDATAELWNENADQWEERSKSETDFSRRQVESLDISPEDTVLDVCCGTGPLTVWLARRAKRVVALDYGRDMLAHVKRKAEELGLKNIETVQGNWHSMTPGVDFPKCDVAVTRHSPAQGDILKFSRCAEKRCYSLWNCAEPYSSGHKDTVSRFIKSEDRDKNVGVRPNGRLYGFNVHFNLLYDMGANPTVNYVENVSEIAAATEQELMEKVMAGRPYLREDEDRIRERIISLENGALAYRRVCRISVLGWDPGEIRDI